MALLGEQQATRIVRRAVTPCLLAAAATTTTAGAAAATAASIVLLTAPCVAGLCCSAAIAPAGGTCRPAAAVCVPRSFRDRSATLTTTSHSTTATTTAAAAARPTIVRPHTCRPRFFASVATLSERPVDVVAARTLPVVTFTSNRKIASATAAAAAPTPASASAAAPGVWLGHWAHLYLRAAHLRALHHLQCSPCRCWIGKVHNPAPQR